MPNFGRLFSVKISLITRTIVRLMIVSLFLVTSLMSLVTVAVETIIYPMQEVKDDTRQFFPLQLLKTILDKTNKQYDLKPASFHAQQERALKLLESGEINVVWSGSNHVREKEYRAIKIPMYKGMFGWRLMLVRRSMKHALKNIHTKQDLHNFAFGMGGDWPDAKLFEANRMKVVTATSYESLFTMLRFKRFELFPRSVLEVWQELELYGELGIDIDPYIVINYPYHSYYFVAKNNHELAEDIEHGFNQLIQSGQYESMFQEAFGEQLERAKLMERRLIRFDNPDLN